MKKSVGIPFVLTILAGGLMLVQAQTTVSSSSLTARAAMQSTPPNVTQLVEAITKGTSPEVVVGATKSVLQAGGIPTAANDTKAAQPNANWYVDSSLALNMALEARGRAYSGRYTVAELAQLWKGLGFPFPANLDVGLQLLQFLQLWVTDAKTKPTNPNSFAPLFIEAMIAQQIPSVNLTAPNTQPEDVRLSLLETELMFAALDRVYQPKKVTLTLFKNQVGADNCAELKKTMSKLGGKMGEDAFNKGVDFVKETLPNAALTKLGLTPSEIKDFNTFKKFFGRVSQAMNLMKFVQMYSANQAVMSVEGEQPVRKPYPSEARKLVPVNATVGIPEKDWQAYQKVNGSSEFQTAKGCLGLLGVPLPPDLKDIADNIAENAEKWRVYWEIVRGAPEHVEIRRDVNNFNASMAGNPFGMKLVKKTETSASATLKLDVQEESKMTAFLKGPLKEADVTVKVSVDVTEPPSPDLLLKLASLAGLIEALGELGVGWFQKALPPSNRITFKVAYHDTPEKFEASMDLNMKYDYGTVDPMIQAVSVLETVGQWNATLLPQVQTLTRGEKLRIYRGTGEFKFIKGIREVKDSSDSRCTYTIDVKTIDGLLTGTIGLAIGAVTPGSEEIKLRQGEGHRFNIGAQPASAPKETYVITANCKDGKLVYPAFTDPAAVVGATNALNVMEDEPITMEGNIPGMKPESWTQKSDGTLERTFTRTGKIPLINLGGYTMAINVVSNNTTMRLKPVYAADAK